MQDARDTSGRPRLLTVGEAAERLNVSKPTVYRRVAQGSLPALRVGDGYGPVRVDEDELEAWLYAPPKGGA